MSESNTPTPATIAAIERLNAPAGTEDFFAEVLRDAAEALHGLYLEGPVAQTWQNIRQALIEAIDERGTYDPYLDGIEWRNECDEFVYGFSFTELEQAGREDVADRWRERVYGPLVSIATAYPGDGVELSVHRYETGGCYLTARVSPGDRLGNGQQRVGDHDGDHVRSLLRQLLDSVGLPDEANG